MAVMKAVPRIAPSGELKPPTISIPRYQIDSSRLKFSVVT
jgi:hypothetical protein